MSDIGAIESGRWHASHFSWKIGAMSLVKVGVFGASAATAAAGTSSATPTIHCVSCLMSVLPLTRILRLDGHFHVSIGPAALETAAALTRLIIGLHAQRVVPRRIEGRRWGDILALLLHGNARL